MDARNPCPPIIKAWVEYFNEASRIANRPPGNVVVATIRQDLLHAGFVDVHEEKLILPLGIWPQDRELKRLGGYGLLNMLDGVEGFTLKLFMKVLGWEDGPCRRFIDQVRKEFKDPKLQIYTVQ